MHMSPAVLGPPIFIPVYLKAVRAGFPSPADDYLDQPIDLDVLDSLQLASAR